MSELTLSAAPLVRTGVVIRRPMTEVWAAFVDPDVTTRFWFTDSTGRIEQDAEVTWSWAMYDASATVRVSEFALHETIVMQWGNDDAGFTTVRWLFDRRSDGVTAVRVEEAGFTGTGDDVVARVLDSTIGFTKMLVAAKALLEHDVVVSVVADG